MITQGQSNAARAIECPKCRVPPGQPCTHGDSIEKSSHAIRTHLYLASVRPMPTAAACLALTEVVGQREDAKPFIHWLDGAHEFRSQSSSRWPWSTPATGKAIRKRISIRQSTWLNCAAWCATNGRDPLFRPAFARRYARS